MNIDCIKCHTRMVQHEAKYVCLLCEHEIEIEDWAEMENVYLKRAMIPPWKVNPKLAQPEGADEYNDI